MIVCICNAIRETELHQAARDLAATAIDEHRPRCDQTPRLAARHARNRACQRPIEALPFLASGFYRRRRSHG